MANKNARLLRRHLTLATRRGDTQLTWDKPVPDYHNHTDARFVKMTFPTALRGANGVNSVNVRRNTVQVIYQNVGEGGVKFSVTGHEVRDKSKPAIFPNHGYLEYRRS